MGSKESLLAVIPARGGSKRFPGKNLASLGSRPLIVWSIASAKASRYISSVVVSTDDKKIAQVSKDTGAITPFVRPHNLSLDTSPTTEVVIHTIEMLKKQGKSYDYVLLLQPTSPLRTAKHIDQAFEYLRSNNGDGVIGVTKVDHPIEWSNVLPENMAMDQFFSSGCKSVRSQDLPERYRINGAIYIADVKRFMDEKTFFFSSNIFAFLMDKDVSIDIDTPLDLKIAEVFLSDS